MGNLLSLLRDEGETLLEDALPGGAELRTIVGALVARAERLEKHVLGELKPAPVADPVVQPSAANTVQPSPPQPPAPVEPVQGPVTPLTPEPQPQPETLDEAEVQLAAAQAKVDELKAQEAPAEPAT